jgi:hypothetical protein
MVTMIIVMVFVNLLVKMMNIMFQIQFVNHKHQLLQFQLENISGEHQRTKR